jgi:hypothetical protein
MVQKFEQTVLKDVFKAYLFQFHLKIILKKLLKLRLHSASHTPDDLPIQPSTLEKQKQKLAIQSTPKHQVLIQKTKCTVSQMSWNNLSG